MNRLSHETSPYLLQHQHNPVDWYAWGDLAFETAAQLDRPVLLSSGYASCHWCHVMAHESFENPTIAAFMNDHFINIKLDREERPDVDQLYMANLHAMGEQGGWPLNMFLTPDRHPFWGGTYFPPEPRYGRPSFLQVLQAIEKLWSTDRNRAIASGKTLITHFRQRASIQTTGQAIPDTKQLAHCADIIANACDLVHGGIKGAPKFPQAPLFQFLSQQAKTSTNPQVEHAVAATLTNIANGGIYDHLAGGIARYSTDDRWLVPHFEKMLYDNAQFISLASRTCLTNGNELLKKRVEQTIEFLFADMTTPQGLFTSSYDADSEGEEGRYYTWTYEELETHLPPDIAPSFISSYGATPAGNFEGRNILNRLSSQPADEPTEALLASGRTILKTIRDRRETPQHDDKVLTDWNALTLTALLEAALAFNNDQWRAQAIQSFKELLRQTWQQGALWHSTRNGITKHPATAHDYALLIEAALTLASHTGDTDALQTGLDLLKAFGENCWSEEAHGFLLTSKNHEDLPANTIPVTDDVTPSPNAVMARNYLTLSYLTGTTAYLDKAHEIVSHHVKVALDNPFAAPALLTAAGLLNETVQITCYGAKPSESPLLRTALSHTGLKAIIIPKTDATAPHSITICRGPTCSLPATNEKGVKDALQLVSL